MPTRALLQSHGTTQDYTQPCPFLPGSTWEALNHKDGVQNAVSTLSARQNAERSVSAALKEMKCSEYAAYSFSFDLVKENGSSTHNTSDIKCVSFSYQTIFQFSADTRQVS